LFIYIFGVSKVDAWFLIRNGWIKFDEFIVYALFEAYIFTLKFVYWAMNSSGWFKFDELGMEIVLIALPAALALAADPIASLIDTAFVGHIGTYVEVNFMI